MFELDVLPDPVDEIEGIISAILNERMVCSDEWQDFRPLLTRVVTQWQAYQEMGTYVATYVVNEMNNWRGYLTDINLEAFFGSASVQLFICAAEALAVDAVVGEHALMAQFMPFLAEQFISIYEC